MAPTPDLRHLWNRGSKGRQDSRQNWYLKLPIPKPLRKHFPRTKTGNEQIAVIEPLDTGDLAVARHRRDELVVRYRRIFDRLSAGESMTPAEIKAAVSLDLEVVAEQYKAKALQIFPLWFRRLAQKYHPDQMALQNFDVFEFEVEEIAKSLGIPIPLNSELYKMVRAALVRGHQHAEDAVHERLTDMGEPAKAPVIERVPESATATPAVPVETVSQAAEAWFAEMQRDPSAAVKQTTLDGHRLRVRAFVEHCGDVPLASVTRAMASDFLAKVAAGGLSNRTVNNYATTLASVFKSARYRGRFTGDNPFDDQKRKAGGESYPPFETAELQTLFDSLALEVKPAKHTPQTALPWISLIAAYTGMRLEEIAQLSVADIRDQQANGATVTVLDVHNGENNALKNAASVRLVPVHSQLVRAGLLDYAKSLPKKGPLFPGLERRVSKGNKIGCRIGELFRDKLETLGLKRDRLCFHSFRHTVAGRLEAAAVSQTDAARVLGHTIPGMSYGVYSTGPGLKRLAAVIEAIEYDGLIRRRLAL